MVSTKNKGRVLVVDDDRSAVDIASRLLAKEGFEVLRAESGPEALAMLAEHTVDVILLDVMMPEMDGLEVCAELRKREHARTIPVILLTARDDLETRVAGMRLGVSEFLTKPISKQELFARVRAQIHQRAIEQGLDDILTE
jgi:DNA-binding response OmpR family regulator